MSDIDIHWSEYIKAGAEAFVLVKTLYPLLPTQSRDEIEAKIAAAERALRMADVALAKGFGFKLHDCTFPPQIMLWDEQIKEKVCPHCGHKTNSRATWGDAAEDDWLSVRR